MVQGEVAGRGAVLGDIEQQRGCRRAHAGIGHFDRRQRRVEHLPHLDAVEACDRDVARHAQPLPPQRADDAEGQEIVRGNDRGRRRPGEHGIELELAVTADEGDLQGLERVDAREVETAGTTTPVPDLPVADLHLLNDGDLTFASVRLEESSVQALLAHARELPDAVDRALAIATVWDMLLKGELATGEVLDCLLSMLETESSPSIVEPAVYGY